MNLLMPAYMYCSYLTSNHVHYVAVVNRIDLLKTSIYWSLYGQYYESNVRSQFSLSYSHKHITVTKGKTQNK